MHYLMDLLRDYAPAVILAAAFLDTLGVPLPAFPFFVLAGCLIAEGGVAWPLVVLAAVVGALAADLVWYYLGKHQGAKAIRFLCRVSMASESCINRSQRFFKNRSLPVILVSKLIPGVNTLVPSLAGIAGISPLRYVLFDAIGCLFWVGAGLGAGMLFDSGVLDHLSEMQPALIALLVAMIAVYVPLRLYNKRRQKQRQPDAPTIDIVPTPTELPTPADL